MLMVWRCYCCESSMNLEAREYKSGDRSHSWEPLPLYTCACRLQAWQASTPHLSISVRCSPRDLQQSRAKLTPLLSAKSLSSPTRSHDLMREETWPRPLSGFGAWICHWIFRPEFVSRAAALEQRAAKIYKLSTERKSEGQLDISDKRRRDL